MVDIRKLSLVRQTSCRSGKAGGPMRIAVADQAAEMKDFTGLRR